MMYSCASISHVAVRAERVDSSQAACRIHQSHQQARRPLNPIRTHRHHHRLLVHPHHSLLPRPYAIHRMHRLAA